MRMAQYTIMAVNDLMVIIEDDLVEDLPSLTNSAESVLKDLDAKIEGLGSRRVFYRDSVGRFDEIRHARGSFIDFVACSPSQQDSFVEMTRDRGAR